MTSQPSDGADLDPLREQMSRHRAIIQAGIEALERNTAAIERDTNRHLFRTLSRTQQFHRTQFDDYPVNPFQQAAPAA